VSESTITGDLQALLASIVESAEDAIVSLDTEGLVTTWNWGADRLYGYRAAEMLGRPYGDILAGEPKEDFARLFALAMAGERVSHYETLRTRRDGTSVEVELSMTPIFALDGTIVGETAILHQISERRRHERESAAKSDLLERAQRVGHIGGWTAGLAPSAPLTCTSETFRIFGTAERSELTTADFYDLVHPEDRARVQEAIYAASTHEGHFELEHRIVRPDGSHRWVLETGDVVSDENRTPVEMIGVVQDITERHDAELKMKSGERTLRLLAQASRDLIFSFRVAPDHAFEFVSSASVAITGYTPTELYDNPQLSDALFDPASQMDLYERLLSNHDVGAVENEVTRKDGSKLWVSQQLNAVRDPSGQLIAIQGITRDISERKTAEARQIHEALHDSLTGLANRALLMDRIERALSRPVGAKPFVGVLFIDLDRFKLFNDSHGQGKGDAVLIAVAERLTSRVKATDTVARLNSDEFVILCEELTLGVDAVTLAERALDMFNIAFDIDGEEVVVKASIGVATARASAGTQTSEELLRNADLAMYRAKGRGGERFEAFDSSLRLDAERRSQAEAGLRRALQHEEFALVFQPVWSIAEDRYVGAEALLRWHDPIRGTIAPGEFILVAEDSGLIVPIGDWALEQACAALVRWSQMGPHLARCTMSVNVSPVQFRSPAFAGKLERVLTDTGVDPQLLCLEITESVLMEDDDSFAAALLRVQGLGVQLSIDDFGTGYSSLAYLQRFPVDEVKIDQSFVKGLGRDPLAAALVRAVIMIGDALGLRIVAEGVESNIQLTALRELGGRHAQGHLFARPCDFEDCCSVITKGHPRP
jgi:diguanylate cyclase (GGDEF)-like protein/PAS domain S-box-containing protein